MQLDAAGQPHLTYCTNVHPGETLGELRQIIRGPVSEVARRWRQEYCASGGVLPFGMGLRLSAAAATELEGPGRCEEFRQLLQDRDLYLFSLNGFPYGNFHDGKVKDLVYTPDWRTRERLAYTDRLARLGDAIAPRGQALSLSTVPGGYKKHLDNESVGQIRERLLQHAACLLEIRDQRGRSIRLALEPEPDCLFETTRQAAEFLQPEILGKAGLASFGKRTGLSAAQSEIFLRDQLGLCFDACHLAVAYENPESALGYIQSAGLRVAKLQISSALSLELQGDEGDTAQLEQLADFDDGIYLHQVVARSRDGQLSRFRDLDDAIRHQLANPQPQQWRVHFHVPVFRSALGLFGSTQQSLRELLRYCQREALCDHYEVETYTWGVLPTALRGDSLTESLVEELVWARDALL